MRSTITLFAVLAAAVSVTAAPSPQAQPPCTSVPTDFWICISDCLYKTCDGDSACVSACDAKCKNKYVPNCEPGPY
ncbi:hypothetical protein QBC42DRAFT_261720 [Cladorrhinum samala]|uniref:Uncharacterized protein n=1 Tax=Cladorrhinum samala TaxID=585594 RepID=A0AAV9I0X6_9PEZI|nr:hypothetical protein QBC42DRAFT_261720 [Cladorrhinum samala]